MRVRFLTHASDTRTMLVDHFLPTYDVSDAVATVVQADVATTWNALMEVDLIDVETRDDTPGS